MIDVRCFNCNKIITIPTPEHLKPKIEESEKLDIPVVKDFKNAAAHDGDYYYESGEAMD